MELNFHFGPARRGERTAYGARTADASLTSIREWADFMRVQHVTRVCCLLDAGQLAGFPVNLEAEYKRLFGVTCVLMEPIPDHHLCSRQALRGNILPFLSAADTRGERAVIHCWGGNGRAGHVLAAWLVAARGLSPMEAIEAAEATGRLPREAVLAGNATLDELIELLASCASLAAQPDARQAARPGRLGGVK
jgi:protein-tyrosine phosphatase